MATTDLTKFLSFDGSQTIIIVTALIAAVAIFIFRWNYLIPQVSTASHTLSLSGSSTADSRMHDSKFQDVQGNITADNITMIAHAPTNVGKITNDNSQQQPCDATNTSTTNVNCHVQ
jgi:hypothetical protein